MRMQRLIDMVCVLSENRKMTVEELADYFQVSRRTIFRDFGTLNRMGISVVSCPAGEDAAAVKEYAIDKKNFSRDETLRIIEAFHGEKNKEDKGKDKDGGYCPCRRECPYHGDCRGCVAVHRARKKCVPYCLRPVQGRG